MFSCLFSHLSVAAHSKNDEYVTTQFLIHGHGLYRKGAFLEVLELINKYLINFHTKFFMAKIK